jgi:YD repeat-containing protein
MSRPTIGKGLYEWSIGVYAASHQDGRGNTSHQTIDPVTGNVLQITAPEVTTGVLGGGTQSISESWQYNSFGQVTSHTNPSGSIDEITYYPSGTATGYRKDIRIDILNLALLTVTARDAFGNMTAVTDPRGHTETLVYNQLDQLVRRISKPPFGYQTDFCYDANDRLASTDVQNVHETGVIQPNASISTTYFYDCPASPARESRSRHLNVTTEYQSTTRMAT